MRLMLKMLVCGGIIAPASCLMASFKEERPLPLVVATIINNSKKSLRITYAPPQSRTFTIAPQSTQTLDPLLITRKGSLFLAQELSITNTLGELATFFFNIAPIENQATYWAGYKKGSRRVEPLIKKTEISFNHTRDKSIHITILCNEPSLKKTTIAASSQR